MAVFIADLGAGVADSVAGALTGLDTTHWEILATWKATSERSTLGTMTTIHAWRAWKLTFLYVGTDRGLCAASKITGVYGALRARTTVETIGTAQSTLDRSGNTNYNTVSG